MKGWVINMLKAKLTNLASGESHDLVCGDFKMLNNKTKSSYKNAFNTLNVPYYGFVNEDNTFIPIEYEFQGVQQISLKDFQQFLRLENSEFLLEISIKNSDLKVLCRFASDTINSNGLLTEYSFKIITNSNFMRVRTLFFELNESDNEDRAYPYTYEFKYGESAGTIDFFKVSLGKNEGNKVAFLRVEIDGTTTNPCFGINKKYSNTDEAYESDPDVIVPENGKLIVSSLPRTKQITLNGANIEQRRNRFKQTYLTLEPNKTNSIIFTNVRSGKIEIYEQYSNIQ